MDNNECLYIFAGSDLGNISFSSFSMDSACAQNSECQNGGTCTNGQCFCNSKFGGLNCERKSTLKILLYVLYCLDMLI